MFCYKHRDIIGVVDTTNRERVGGFLMSSDDGNIIFVLVATIDLLQSSSGFINRFSVLLIWLTLIGFVQWPPD